MYGVILVPVDGSPLGERSLSLAIPVAEQHGARLVLLHVHQPPPPITAIGGGVPVRDPGLDHHLRNERQKYLERLTARLRRETALAIEPVFREGPVIPTIESFIREAGVDLIVMSTHGRGGFRRLWLGSVADGLLRRAPVPLLLIRGGRGRSSPGSAAPPFSRILVPLDGSPLAERAVEEAQKLVGSSPAHLTLAHVVHPALMLVSQLGGPRGGEQAQAQARAWYLEPLAERLRSESLTVSTEVVVHTSVHRGLLDLAKHTDADLIAITSQGQGGVQRLLLGSVADKLIRSATSPMLVCSGPRPTAAA